jgi:dipeptidyl aminopeptidase/acylaminoacyl peptidase
MRPLTSRTHHEAQPQFSPDGTRILYWYPKGGETRNNNEIVVAPASGGEGRSATSMLDRHILTASWMRDGQSLLLGASDGTKTGVWIQPIDGAARKLDAIGRGFRLRQLSVSTSRDGRMAFIASTADRPATLRRLGDRAPDGSPTGASRPWTSGRPDLEWDGPTASWTVSSRTARVSGRAPVSARAVHPAVRSVSKISFSALAALPRGSWIVFEPNYRGSDNLVTNA